MERNRTEGRGHTDLKKGLGQAGSRGGCLKKGWLEPPTNYDFLSLYKRSSYDEHLFVVRLLKASFMYIVHLFSTATV